MFISLDPALKIFDVSVETRGGLLGVTRINRLTVLSDRRTLVLSQDYALTEI